MRFTLKHAALATACVAAFPAYATNGYFLPGAGIRSQGMGGVGIAYGRDSLSIGANPANIVNTGMRGDLGFGIFNPERYAAVGSSAGGSSTFGFNGSSESDSKYFIMPEMGMTMPLTESLHAGFAVLGNGGMNTTYRTNIFSSSTISPDTPPADKTIGVDMMQLIIPLTVGYRLNDMHSLGASLNVAETRFRAYGLDEFLFFDQFFGPITAYPNNLTDQGYDYSYGAGVRLGWLGEFLDKRVTVGLTWASKTYMSKLDKYKGLFAEQGGFDIPETYGIGIAFKPRKNLLIAADVSRILYSEVPSIGNRGPNGISGVNGVPSIATASGGTSPYELGNDQGMGFGWQDQTVYKLGVQYGVNNRLQLRAGFNYGKSPIPNDQLTFGTLAPATVEKHYSVGFTYKANENLEVTGMYMYVASNNQKATGQNFVNNVQIGMHQNVWGLSLGWVLDPGPRALDEYGETEMAPINFDGWYAGLGIGQSRYRSYPATSENGRTEGWKVYGGYQFNKYLALEGGYVNLNDVQGVTGTVRTDIATEAWMFGPVLSYPLTNKLSLMARVGAAYMQGDTRTKNGSALTVRSSDDGYEPFYGVGARYAVFDNLGVRAEWERYDRDNYKIDLLTAGLDLKF